MVAARLPSTPRVAGHLGLMEAVGAPAGPPLLRAKRQACFRNKRPPISVHSSTRGKGPRARQGSSHAPKLGTPAGCCSVYKRKQAAVSLARSPMATIKSEFTERLYEFCVNFELVSTVGAFIAGYVPGVPSPQDEADLGWDAKVSMPRFGQTFLLQYKMSRRTTARAGANAKFWDVYGADYHRFSLHRDAGGAFTQHQLLFKAQAVGVQAIYCAPLILGRGELVRALQTRTVVERSALIPVAMLGPVTSSEPHSVTYPLDERSGPPTLHSEPQRGERVRLGDLQSPQPDRQRRLDARSFDDFSEIVLESKRRRRHRERSISVEDPLAAAYLRASAIAQDELGATLVVLPEQPG